MFVLNLNTYETKVLKLITDNILYTLIHLIT